VVLSLLLLTAYFGEAPNGRLHGIQRDFLTVVSPVQDGANKALKPVRDLFSWFGNTLHAKSQLKQALAQTEKLRRELVAEQGERRSYHELLALSHLDQLGLVGKVAQAAPDGALVELLTNSAMGVAARIGTSRATGLVQPKVGDPNDLLLQYLPTSVQPNPGEYVVTSGTVTPAYPSLFPPGLLIGQVTSVNEESAYKSVNVHPVANLHNLDIVQVLTAAEGTRAANLSALTVSLPAGQSTGTVGSGGGEQLASTQVGG